MPVLNLLVLRSAQLEQTLRFYEIIGLTFVEEQHGAGPLHYACEMGTQVIELYPAEAEQSLNRKMGGATMLGFQVAALDDVLTQLQTIGIMPLGVPKDTPWGRQATVLDPDGRAIQISQPVS